MTDGERQAGQPYVAAVTSLTAGLALIAVWWVTLAVDADGLEARTSLVLIGLFAALILTYHFPIHVEQSSKVYMGSVVLYLMAALLPPATAASAIGVGILAGELSVRQRTGNHLVLTIIPTQVARWCVIGLVASIVAHVPAEKPVLMLLAAAVVMWVGDILTGPLLISPLLNQNPFKVMSMMIREGGAVEAAQYLIGFLGVLVATDQPWALVLLLPPTALVYVAFKRAQEVRAQTRRMLEDMADLVDLRDGYSGGHSRRVAELARDVMRAMGGHHEELEAIVTAARVHDIGKVGIPDRILQKPGPLTPAEWAVMQTHAEKGAELLLPYPDLAGIAGFIRHHHEAWDGTGYPHRLAGFDIPFGSRVIAVAESYDGMISDRPYRRRLSHAEAAAMLRAGRGSQWDPDIVDTVLRILRDQSEETSPAPLRLVREIEPEGRSG